MSDPRQWPDVHRDDHAEAAPATSEEYAWPGDCTEFVFPEQPPALPQESDGESDSDAEEFHARWWPNLSKDWA